MWPPRRGGGWARAARPAEHGPARGGDSGRSLGSGAGSGVRSSAVLCLAPRALVRKLRELWGLRWDILRRSWVSVQELASGPA